MQDARAGAGREPFSLWGSALSPFALKVEALLRFSGLPFRWLPAEGSRREALRFGWRREQLIRRRIPLSFPPWDALDEFPLVPFLFGPQGENLYDSSAIGIWLDARGATQASALVPAHDPALRFAVQLVDEALDEIGLYLVHHNRWVIAARDNGAGERLARELRPLLGPFTASTRFTFPARQVRRLPYLFSVATTGAGFHDPATGAGFHDLPARLRPPARAGFPPTHALLDQLFASLLAALEPLLTAQPFLFGERFTLADASVYGQLAMNLSDPSANALIRRLGPSVHAWVSRLAGGDFAGHRADGRLLLSDAHAPLFTWIGAGFVPLMQQNRAAFERERAGGGRLFNEAAFDAGRALYDGVLCGQPFRSVAKSFQVRVWRDLMRAWRALPAEARARVAALLPREVSLDDGIGE